MCRRHAFGIFHPRFRQIKPPVDEGMAVARHIGGQHADPASDSCRRAPCTGAQRRTTPRPVKKTGLVDDKNRVPIEEHHATPLAGRLDGRRPGLGRAAAIHRAIGSVPAREVPDRFDDVVQLRVDDLVGPRTPFARLRRPGSISNAMTRAPIAAANWVPLRPTAPWPKIAMVSLPRNPRRSKPPQAVPVPHETATTECPSRCCCLLS
jgi:hypothetical protein